MYCRRCGCMLPNGAPFCPNCGEPVVNPAAAPTPPVTPVYYNPVMPVNPVAAKYTSFFSDALFLTMCILVSVTALFSLLGGDSAFNSSFILQLLFAIFMWMTYSGAKSGRLNGNHMRMTSGTVYAMVIVNWILTGLLAVLGILIPILFNYAGSVINYIGNELYGTIFSGLWHLSVNALGIVLMVIFLVCALVNGLFTYFGLMKFHKLAKSMYISVMSGVERLEKLSGAKVWLLVLGIVQGLSALSDLIGFANVTGFVNVFGFLGELCCAAVYIVAYIWVGKNFTSNPMMGMPAEPWRQ